MKKPTMGEMTGAALLALSMTTTAIVWSTQRQIENAVNAEKVLAHFAMLDAAAAKTTKWEEEHDVRLSPMVQRHAHFFDIEWPEWKRKTEMVYRYVLRHATEQDLAPMKQFDLEPPSQGLYAAEPEQEKRP